MRKMKSTTEASVVIYDTLYKLPYPIFKAVMVESDLSLLTVSGNPDPGVLAGTWEKIIEAYAESFGNTSPEDWHYWHTYKSYIHHLQKQTFERLLIESLTICYHPEWSKDLYSSLLIANQWKKLDPENPEEYFKELNRLFNRTKDIYIQVYKTQLEGLQEKRKEQTGNEDMKPTYEKFIATENSLSLHFKMQFSFDNMSTAQFVDLMKRYNLAAEQLRHQLKSKR
jgi:hypothetical protein